MHCKACGEVLLGAVNRCWKCGAVAEVALPDDSPSNRQEPLDVGPSPFGPPVVETLDVAQEAVRRDTASLADGTGSAAIVIGVFALLLSRWTGWTVVPAFIGLCCGLSALRHRRRWWYFLGIMLSLVALLLAGSLAVSSLREFYQLHFEQVD